MIWESLKSKVQHHCVWSCIGNTARSVQAFENWVESKTGPRFTVDPVDPVVSSLVLSSAHLCRMITCCFWHPKVVMVKTTKEAWRPISLSKAVLLLSFRKTAVNVDYVAVTQQPVCMWCWVPSEENVLQRSSPSQKLDFSLVTEVAATAQIKGYRAAEM